MAYDDDQIAQQRQQLAALGQPAAAPPPTGAPPPAAGGSNTLPRTANGGVDLSNPQTYGNAINHGVGQARDALASGYNAVTGFLTPAQADLTGIHGAAADARGTAAGLAGERAAFGGFTAPTIDQQQAQQTRAQQLQALQALKGAANGTTTSAAELQAEQARQANVANQLGLAAATHGRSPGAALAAVANSTAAINSQAAANGAIQRATEQANARNALVGALGGVRSQDQQVATDQAQLNFGTNAQNVDWQKALLSGQLGSQGQEVTAEGDAAKAGADEAASTNSYKGSIIGGAGSILGMLSDRRAKTGIHAADQDANQMLDALRPESFEYKPGTGEAPGRRLGVMAQDMERSPAGRGVVRDGPVKTIDVHAALSASLAALAALNHRVRRIEGGSR